MQSTASVQASEELSPARRLANAQATRALGAELANRLRSAATPTLLLIGDLGAGKTCLVQGMAEALGISEPITSPTFALAQHYSGSHGSLVHLDLYRLEQAAAADELLAQEEEHTRELGAVLAVEWPERLSSLPSDCWRVELTLLDSSDPERGRLAVISPPEQP